MEAEGGGCTQREASQYNLARKCDLPRLNPPTPPCPRENPEGGVGQRTEVRAAAVPLAPCRGLERAAQKLCSGASEAGQDKRPKAAWPSITYTITSVEEASIGAFLKTSRIGTMD